MRSAGGGGGEEVVVVHHLYWLASCTPSLMSEQVDPILRYFDLLARGFAPKSKNKNGRLLLGISPFTCMAPRYDRKLPQSDAERHQDRTGTRTCRLHVEIS